MEKLSKIEKVDLKKFWKNEKEFTEWLARKENLLLLGKEIGINIELVQVEASAGDFSVDILAEEENTGRKIIIENQLERTDHDHLGKLLAYASAHNAKFIIWIAKNIRDEHKDAIEWLNSHTDEEVNVFAVKIELWQIAGSPTAPKFDIASEPSSWAKTIKKATRSGELSELALKELEFLNRFIEFCEEQGTNLRLGRPQPSAPAYYQIPIGVSEAWIAIKLNASANKLKAEIYFTNKDLFYKIKKRKEEIEEDFGKKLEWNEMPELKGSLVGKYFEFDLDSEKKWEEYFKKIKGITENLQRVFLDRIIELR